MIKLPIAAIDPSLTSTGLAFGIDETDVCTMAVKSKPRGEGVSNRVKRYELVIQQLTKVLDVIRPRLVLIEGYSFGSKNGKHMDMAELGGLIRWHSTDYTPHILEVAPTTLKKFATGKGAGDKALIQAHVMKRWGKMFETSDEADAFVLFQMALCIAGRQEPQTQPQREAVDKVLSGHTATGQQITEFCLDTGADKPF